MLNVTLNRRVKTTALDPSLLATNFPKTVGADKAWAAGYTGKGVGVAVIDSGINGDHPDFKNADGTSRVTNVIANPASTRAGDDVGHGTHVAGIVAGNSAARPATDAKAGAYEGIAPEADIIAVKTADDQGNSTTLDVINALEFVVNHKDELNIDVVNLSVSSDTPGSYLLDPLDAAVEFAWHAGIVVVSAVGNRGSTADATHYAPGNDPFVISVGATDESDTANPADDTVATFSSRGPGLDGFNKPDVYAPGARIVAPLAAGSAFNQLCPTCVVADEYLRIGGTSMAAPVVAGAAALLLQARPELNPDQVKELLTANVNLTADRAAQLDVSKALAAPGRPRRQPGHGPGPGGPGRAARGRPGPDARHLDEGDLDQGDLDEGDVDEGDVDEGDLDGQRRPEERPVGAGDLDVLDLHGHARGGDRADEVHAGVNRRGVNRAGVNPAGARARGRESSDGEFRARDLGQQGAGGRGLNPPTRAAFRGRSRRLNGSNRGPNGRSPGRGPSHHDPQAVRDRACVVAECRPRRLRHAAVLRRRPRLRADPRARDRVVGAGACSCW